MLEKTPKLVIETREYFLFNGLKFYNYPDSKCRTAKNYYICTDQKQGKRVAKFLHVAIWESHNGPIIKGSIIHHKDGDPKNNNIENLQAMTRGEHSRLHRKLDSEKNIRLMRLIGPDARKKAQSIIKENKEQFRKNCSIAQLKRRATSFRCIICNKNFLSASTRPAKFCSNKCLCSDNRRKYHEKREGSLC